MKDKSGVKTFINAVLILLVMLVFTGILTYVIPNGTFDPENRTFELNEEQGISIRSLVLAPILVLFSNSGPLIIGIIVFLIIIGGALHVLQQTGLIEGVILKISTTFSKHEGLLLGSLVLIFMSLGAFIGVFEEVVPLIPMVILLSRKMGWDDLTGLGVSVLACGLGFAAAISNPFTIGVAQGLAGLPMFSGALLRVGVFISVYILILLFLRRHVSKTRTQQTSFEINQEVYVPRKAYVFFISLMALMIFFISASPLIPFMRDLSLPIIALIFLISGLGVGLIVSNNLRWVLKQYGTGAVQMAPAIVLVLLATGIKHVLEEGFIIDRILYLFANNVNSFSPFSAIIVVFLLVLCLNFFIGSGSAKAFILMPVLMPIMDLLGMGRQLGILAFQFGDGFTNVLYPTNAVLLIALGLSKVSYSRWLKFIWPLQLGLFLLCILWLAFAYGIGYGL